LGPTLEKLAKEARGAWVLAKVNVDNNPRLAQAFGVQGIPAVKGVANGRLVAEFTGAQPESQVRAWLKRFVPERAEEAPAEDLFTLAERDPVAAEARARAILEQDPANDEACVALGQSLVQALNPEGAELLRAVQPASPQYSRAQAWLTLNEMLSEVDSSAAFDLLARVDAQPGDLEARYALAAHQIAGHRYGDAIDNLMAIVARNREFRSDGARKALVALFTGLGDGNALVGPARRQLANLLF
ncbi:MAG TPA: tetratricopeptide repeat protein, partial [Roseiflexaceae bacterium]|nr:tetratricopeptide repeat protein [Roseiflexaceae bacterium]